MGLALLACLVRHSRRKEGLPSNGVKVNHIQVFRTSEPRPHDPQLPVSCKMKGQNNVLLVNHSQKPVMANYCTFPA